MAEGPFDFRESSRRKGEDLRNMLEDLALPACAEGEEPDGLEVGSLWYNTTTDTPRYRTPGGDIDIGTSAGTITNVTAGAGLSGGGSSGSISLDVDFGTTAGTATEGNDARLPTADQKAAMAAASAPSGANAFATIADLPAGDITAVTAGTAMTGGGSSGAVTLNVNIGTGAGTAAAGNDARFPTTDQKAAMTAASTPSDANAFATMNDLAGAGQLTADELDAVQGAATPSASNVFATMADLPTGDITAVTAGTAMTGGGSSGAVTLNVNIGTGSGTAAAGNDSRFPTTDQKAAMAAAASPSGANAFATIADLPTGDITAVTVSGPQLTGGASSGSANVALTARQTFTYSASRTLDTSTGFNFVMTDDLTGDITITLSNIADNYEGSIWMKQDGTGGHELLDVVVSGRTVIWEAGVRAIADAADAYVIVTFSAQTVGGDAVVYVNTQPRPATI